MIEGYVREMLEADRSPARLGITVSEVDAGRAIAHLTVTPDMANGLGVAQGGFVFALADQAFACAANSVAPGTATVDASISYLAPARVGDALRAEAALFFADERRVVVDVTVRSGDAVVAIFRGIGRAMRPVVRPQSGL